LVLRWGWEGVEGLCSEMVPRDFRLRVEGERTAFL